MESFFSILPNDVIMLILFELNDEESLTSCASEFPLIHTDDYWRYKFTQSFFIGKKDKGISYKKFLK